MLLRVRNLNDIKETYTCPLRRIYNDYDTLKNLKLEFCVIFTCVLFWYSVNMFRINRMSLHGLEKDRDEGLVLRWQPEGFLIEMAKQKVYILNVVTLWSIQCKYGDLRPNIPLKNGCRILSPGNMGWAPFQKCTWMQVLTPPPTKQTHSNLCGMPLDVTPPPTYKIVS